MIGFGFGVLVGVGLAGVAGVLLLLDSAYRKAEEEKRDVIENMDGFGRVNLTKLSEVRQARAMMRREGVGGNW